MVVFDLVTLGQAERTGSFGGFYSGWLGERLGERLGKRLGVIVFIHSEQLSHFHVVPNFNLLSW